MMCVSFAELYEKAKSVLNPRRLSEHAEHAAAGAMVTAGESQVLKMVAVGWDGRIMPPCGRCREFISQLHDENMSAEVLVAEGGVVRLRELLPYDHKQVLEA
jgi:cytidine deaminase